MADETLTEKQVRLVLERQCREAADLLKSKTPAGVGFVLFFADFGEVGNTAYVSTVARESAIKLIQEWLDHQDETHDVERLKELLDVAGWGLAEIASAAGYDGDVADLTAVIEHCRQLRERAGA